MRHCFGARHDRFGLCANQSRAWGGAQMVRVNVAVRANREGAVNSVAAMQARAGMGDIE